MDNFNLSMTIVLAGLVVVFAVLVVLICLIQGYSKIVRSLQKNDGKPQQAELSAPCPVLQPAAAEGIPGEVVAAIAAVVAVMDDSGTASYTVKSIRRSRSAGFRPVWGMAGVMENTRPF